MLTFVSITSSKSRFETYVRACDQPEALLATLADRIFDTWPDPAGLGPPISDGMDKARKQRARDLLLAASRDASNAIHLSRQGRNGDALKAWRALFGPKFPLS